jgi:hypothetical protein
MSNVRNLTLRFLECSGIEAGEDVLDIAEMVANFGLRPGAGTYTATTQLEPVEDVRAYVQTTHLETPGGGRPDRRFAFERWVYGTVWLAARGILSDVTIARRGGARDWDVTVTIQTWSYQFAGLPLEVVAEHGADLLVRVGAALYPRIQPALGLIYGVGNDDVEMPPAVLRRQLMVGWQTWYGPTYVEKYGRELLLGLPDRTEMLDDGGVFHALNVAPLDLVTGKRGIYTGVAAYLGERDIRPAWPRLPRSKSNATPRRRKEVARAVDDATVDDASLDVFQDEVRALLSNAIVLDTGLRVLMVPLAWSELNETQQTIVYQNLLQVVRFLLAEHPGSRIRVEFEEMPADLQQLLATTYPAGGPVSYGLLTDPPAL